MCENKQHTHTHTHTDKSEHNVTTLTALRTIINTRTKEYDWGVGECLGVIGMK